MIKRAAADDIEDIIEIWRESVSIGAFTHLGIDNIQHFFPGTDVETVQSQKSTFILQEQQRIIGFVIIIEDLIGLMMVRPGVSQTAFHKLYGFALMHIANKYDAVRVECYAENSHGNEAITRLGFEFIGSYGGQNGFQTNAYYKSLF